MSSRTRKTMIAEAFGEEIEYQTAGPYDIAGVMIMPDPDNNFPRKIVAVGTSYASVTSRTRTIARRVRSRLLKSDERHVMQVTDLIEATAPVLREYFGTHRVAFDSWYTEQDGWTAADGDIHAGRTLLRKMIREGATTFHCVSRTKSGDFQAAELLKSMNSRKKA